MADAASAGGRLDKDLGEGELVWRCIDKTSENQCYFLAGHAVGFLAMLYMATHEDVWLRLARGYYDVIETSAADRHRHTSAGKFGFGASYLALATGDEDVRRSAMEVGEYLMEIQATEGYWVFPVTEYTGPDAIAVDLTAEFVAWLAEIATTLS